MQRLIIISALILIGLNLSAQDRVKVMSYNLLNYGNTTSYCTQSNNNMTAKTGYNATIINYVKPDILGVVEMGSSDFVHNRFLDSVLNVNGVSHYAKANKMNLAGSTIISLLYYIKKNLVWRKLFLFNIKFEILFYSDFIIEVQIWLLHMILLLSIVLLHT